MDTAASPIKSQILDRVKALYDFKNSYFVDKDITSLPEKRDDAVDRLAKVSFIQVLRFLLTTLC